MKNHVVESYENYREETRLTTNNARRIEFLNTVRILNEWLPVPYRILDCAAGTGVYACYLAERGHDVTATDLTPRHIDVLQEALKNKTYAIQTAVMDATNLSAFENERFDVVLNMGPLYHLVEEADRLRCLRESMRVLKKGGLLVAAYIPRFFVFQHVAMQDSRYLDAALSDQLLRTGVLRQEDEKCFWTDTYFATAEEMETLYHSLGLAVVDHFAQDGIAPQFADRIDRLEKEQFQIWCDHHYRMCREKSVLGASNHVMIIGRK